MKCDIIIPIWNQLDYTMDCILSIVKNTKYPYRLILVDNASDIETKNYLKSLVGPGGFLNPLRFNLGKADAICRRLISPS